MKKIKLRGKWGVGKFALIDDDDFERVSKKVWRLQKIGYVSENHKTGILMHRFILNAKEGEYVDHINHNKLDNQKRNIRICSNEVNNWNRDYKRIIGVSSSKIIGKPYRAYINKFYKQIHLGYFKTKEEAIIAYDNAVAEMRDIYAFKNKQL